MKLKVLVVVSFAMLANNASANDCNDGLAAYVAGDFQSAYEIFQPLSKANDACAQYQLGTMYSLGQGVEKDKQEALRLFRLSAGNGSQKAKVQLRLLESK